MFQLENDVPMPPSRNQYPFADMQPGQSFAIRGEEEARKVRNASYQFTKKVNEKATTPEEIVSFSVRKTGEEDTGQVDGEGKPIVITLHRCWRE